MNDISQTKPDVKIGQISAQWCKSAQIPHSYTLTTLSTNDLAKDEAFEQAAEDAFKIYISEQQTQGRGRGSNTWISGEMGSALLSSWSFALQDPPQPQLTAKVGLALIRACSGTWPFLNWSLKAPNDLYLNDKKVAGLLVEVVSEAQDVRLIIGLGLNVWSAPTELKTATHVARELPPEAPLTGEDWIHFLERWMFELTEAVGQFDQELTSTECIALKSFLNRHPHTRIEQVLADGSLIFTDGKQLHWKDL
jgi:BirA family transcriptional regulator, biotin operon repressor / biotin---[acetyl-CoA-carboxylase] ligase